MPTKGEVLTAPALREGTLLIRGRWDCSRFQGGRCREHARLQIKASSDRTCVDG